MSLSLKKPAVPPCDCLACMCRHGPAFGTTASQEAEGCDPLCEVLAVNGRRCSLADRNDVLCRHVTGAALLLASLSTLCDT